jgi:hypothetical protein
MRGQLVDPKLQRILDGWRSAKPSTGDASVALESQQQVKSEGVTSDVNTCAYTFTSGAGYTYLQFCVTVNGNIVEFQSPAGEEQIDQGTIQEGYGVCDLNTNIGYFDYSAGGTSANWDAQVLVSKTATLVKISRTTSDGLWTLTQTITNTPGPNPSARVTMALKNNSTVAKEAYLMRFADVDPGYTAGADAFPTGYEESFNSHSHPAVELPTCSIV